MCPRHGRQPQTEIAFPSAAKYTARMDLGLSPRQKKTIAAALTLLAALVIVLVVAVCSWLFAAFVNKFSGVFMPLAVALILALVIKPYFTWLHRQSELITPIMAIFIIYISVLIPIGLLGWFFGGKLMHEAHHLLEELPGSIEALRARLDTSLQGFWERYKWGETVREYLAGKGEELFELVKTFLSSVMQAGVNAFRSITGLLGWFVVPVYLAFFLMMNPVRKRDKEDYFPFLRRETRRDVIYLMDEFVNIMVSFFRGQLLVALSQGLLFAVGFSICGLHFGFAIGMLLGFLNIIPYLGSMVGLAIAIPLALFQNDGGLWVLSGVGITFVVVQMIEAYVLTPRIMGERTGLHPMAIIVAIFFWGTAFEGIIGMVLAIPLTAFLVVFWRLAKKKEYLHNWF